MADSIRTDTLRNEQARLLLERQSEQELHDLREKHKLELEKDMAYHETVKKDLDHAYEVALSVQKDDYEKKLTDVRATNAKQLDEEKAHGDEELEKTKTRAQQQIAHYKATNDKVVEDIRKQAENSEDSLRRSHRSNS